MFLIAVGVLEAVWFNTANKKPDRRESQIMIDKVIVFIAAASLCVGCATVESQRQSVALTSAAPVARAEDAPQDAAVEQDTDESAKSDDDRIICRSIMVTGSRIAKERVCGTAKEWADHKKRSREELERTQRGMDAYTFNEHHGRDIPID
ncbi:MAG: hypothetical protein KDA48_05330 [Amphiplicatus sp.]|nr:hypothetical protein [Amphiplicatus sp.]MCB9954288.1 hypothetical protein [Caulobacterales bacterium]